MTKATVSKSMRKLPVEDRIELLDELWFSIAADQREMLVSDAHKAMIDERLKEIEEHPEEGMPLAEFRKKLQQTSKRMRAGKRRKNAA